MDVLLYFLLLIGTQICATLKGYASPDHHRPTTKLVMLYDVTGSNTFTAAAQRPPSLCLIKAFITCICTKAGENNSHCALVQAKGTD